LAQGEDFIPIPSTTKLAHLEENLLSTQIQFNQTELNDIRDICEKYQVVGEPCPKNMSHFLFSDSAPQ
ncbi:unnamed protein product, partial [Adineta ricciae]